LGDEFTKKENMVSASGFSLLEVLLALAVGGILLFMATSPSLMMTNKSKFENNATILQDTLQQARNMARNNNQCVEVVVNVLTRQVIVTPYSNLPCVLPFGGPIAANILTTPFDNTVTLTNFTPLFPLDLNTNGGIVIPGGLPAAVTTMTLSEFGYTKTFSILPTLGQIEMSQ
jgi:prepilin-type N-terminal cleavage/methylation domain-containing protein